MPSSKSLALYSLELRLPINDDPPLEEDSETSFSSNSLESLSPNLFFLDTTFLGGAFDSAFFFGGLESGLGTTFFVVSAFLLVSPKAFVFFLLLLYSTTGSFLGAEPETLPYFLISIFKFLRN